jgi:CDGSH-type Zn-finger protein/uncharacterized Fe-S cluster protein YjdI
MKKERVIKYRGQFINVFFNVDRCTHVSECLRGSAKVFTVIRSPWIMPDLEPADKVAEVILRCPTGALHFERNDGGEEEQIPEKNTITIVRDGPLNALGNMEIFNSKNELLYKDTRLALCRCGKSKHKPLCDDAHHTSNFINIGRIFSENESIQAFSSPTGVLKITWNENGPFQIKGPFSLFDSDGKLGFQDEKALLCGCGKSENKPFCDGTHAKGFFSRHVSK